MKPGGTLIPILTPAAKLGRKPCGTIIVKAVYEPSPCLSPPGSASLTPDVCAHVLHRDDAMHVVQARKTRRGCLKQRGSMQARNVTPAIEIEPDDTIRVF